MKEKLLIKEVPDSSLPRERLIRQGEKSLSDQELLAICLRTGQHPIHVMDLAANVLGRFMNLYTFKGATIEELMEIKGIGKVKAIEIRALIELGRRMEEASQPKVGKIRASFDLAQQLIHELKDYQQEHFICFYLNTKNEIIQKETLFVGSLNQSVAHPREIFHGAVRYHAASLIIAHNHPSGDATPSGQDIMFTQRLSQCGEMMGIELLDHIIIGHSTYTSLKEDELLKKK
ncbi:DNA repair protein RadC [Enterococcus sp. AZ194]|uniref:RadC family protein n=1 Tax=Enterococcus sp. AZ194 TaxID=2774629 RepID=UPI003F210FB2